MSTQKYTIDKLVTQLKELLTLTKNSQPSGPSATEAKQDDIITALAGIDTINSTIVVNSDSIERTPGLVSVSNATSIAAGAKEVSFYNAGAAIGTVLGTNVPVGATVSFVARDNDTLSAIAYDATATIFLIQSVR